MSMSPEREAQAHAELRAQLPSRELTELRQQVASDEVVIAELRRQRRQRREQVEFLEQRLRDHGIVPYPPDAQRRVSVVIEDSALRADVTEAHTGHVTPVHGCTLCALVAGDVDMLTEREQADAELGAAGDHKSYTTDRPTF